MIRHGSHHAVSQNHRRLRALGVVVFVAIVVVIFLLVQGGRVVGRQSLSHFDSLVRPRAPFHRSNSFAIGHLSKGAG